MQSGSLNRRWLSPFTASPVLRLDMAAMSQGPWRLGEERTKGGIPVWRRLGLAHQLTRTSCSGLDRKMPGGRARTLPHRSHLSIPVKDGASLPMPVFGACTSKPYERSPSLALRGRFLALLFLPLSLPTSIVGRCSSVVALRDDEG